MHTHNTASTSQPNSLWLLQAGILAVALTTVPLFAHSQTDSEFNEEEPISQLDARTQETLDLIKRTTEQIQATIHARAATLRMEEEIKRTTRQIDLAKKRKQLEILTAPPKAKAQVVKKVVVQKKAVVHFPVRTVTRVEIGRRPRARLKLDATSSNPNQRVQIGSQVDYRKDGRSGIWEISGISKDGVSFVHTESGETRFLARQ